MAGQGLERREVLRIMALAAAASGYPGFHRWSFACEHGGSKGFRRADDIDPDPDDRRKPAVS